MPLTGKRVMFVKELDENLNFCHVGDYENKFKVF